MARESAPGRIEVHPLTALRSADVPAPERTETCQHQHDSDQDQSCDRPWGIVPPGSLGTWAYGEMSMTASSSRSSGPTSPTSRNPTSSAHPAPTSQGTAPNNTATSANTTHTAGTWIAAAARIRPTCTRVAGLRAQEQACGHTTDNEQEQDSAECHREMTAGPLVRLTAPARTSWHRAMLVRAE
ncbi:hypothetical protein [Kibdelosporangium philippinense]|uniref:hypothetical protein n=1 Tax=Kibdelosporangium philippinense TaxID=211113 RepID=UPI0036083787